MSSRRPIIRRVEGTLPSDGTNPEGCAQPEDNARPESHESSVWVDLPLDHAAAPDFPASVPAPSRRRDGTRSRSRRPWWLALLFVAAVPAGLLVGYSMQPLPARPVLSTDLLAFGELAVGTRDERVIRLTNAGEGPLTVHRWSVVDDADGSFELTAPPPCLGSEMAPNSVCDARVRFAPQQGGVLQARLKLITGPSSNLTVLGVPLLGRGAEPGLDLQPRSLQFAPTTVGYRAESTSLTVSNPGGAPLLVDGIEMDGLGAADFVLETDSCVGRPLAAGAQCRITLRFVPTAAGERRATLRLRTSPALAAPAVDMRGLGQAQSPRLEVSSHELRFGDVRLDGTSETTELRLRNSGDGPLEIRRISIRDLVVRQAGPTGRELGPLISPERLFRWAPEACLGAALQPGEECPLALTFHPTGSLEDTSALSFAAVLWIEHNAAAAGLRVPLAGRGTAPRLETDTDRLPFGNVPVGRPSPWVELRISNTGSAPLSLERVSVRGTDADRFEPAVEGCVRAPIPPGRSCSLQVRFTPRRPGPHRAVLHLSSDAVAGPRSLPINGLGDG